MVDSSSKVIEGVQNNGMKYLGAGMNIGGNEYYVVENPEWIRAIIDSDYKILCGIKQNGKFYADLDGIDEQVKELIQPLMDEVEELVNRFDEIFKLVDSPEFISVELDSDDKILGGRKIDGTKFENVGLDLGGGLIKGVDDPEGRMEIKTDSTEKIISYRKDDGTLVENVGIETNHLELTSQGMTDFQQSLKDAGFKGGHGDYSDYISNDGDNPLCLPEPRIGFINILNDYPLNRLSKKGYTESPYWPAGVKGVTYDIPTQIEFWDNQGNYFKKWAFIGGQGQSTMNTAKKNIAIDLFDSEADGDAFAVKFGNWIAQDSFHLKGYTADFYKGMSVICYKLSEQVGKTRNVLNDTPYKRALYSSIKFDPNILLSGVVDDVSLKIDDGAKCMPDGFPCIVYQQGKFWGLFALLMKKSRSNYHLNKKNAKHIHVDGNLGGNFFRGNPNWTTFEPRNPKDLYYKTAHTKVEGGGSTYKYDSDDPGQFEIADQATVNSWIAAGHLPDGSELDVKRAQNTAKVHKAITDICGRLVELDDIVNVTRLSDQVVISPAEFKGTFALSKTFDRGNLTIDNGHYYMSMHNGNTNHALTDTEYWYPFDEKMTQARAFIETYFDVPGLIDYELIQCAVYDGDATYNNCQWLTWDGVKWFPCEYDKDNVFGNKSLDNSPRETGGWSHTSWGDAQVISNSPLGLIRKFYALEAKARWQELVSKDIFTTANLMRLFTDWMQRIGTENYITELNKWNSAGNGEFKVADGWEYISNTTSPGCSEYNSNTQYSTGDRCYISLGYSYYLVFEATESISGVNPLISYSWSASIGQLYAFIDDNFEKENSFFNSL